jgi:hypothetical protein
MAVTLFVSHAPADDAFAQALTQALVEAGVDARAETFGPDQPTPGNDRAIAVRECAIFLPVLSRAALSSPRARSEARRFHDTYHGASGRYLLPVLVEPLELEELWPFLQEYQRIEGPPGEQWSPDALIAGVLQWVTQVIPARARTPSGALRLSGSPAPRTGLPTRPLGEELLALPPERVQRTIQRRSSALSIMLIVVLAIIIVGGLSVAALLLGGQAPSRAVIAKPNGTAKTAATRSSTDTSTAIITLSPTPTIAGKTTVFNATPTPLPAVLAAFVSVDATTQGAWRGVYGSQGYLLAPNENQYSYSSIPSYATVDVNDANTAIWAASTSDPRALQKPGMSDRIAAYWYRAGAFIVDLALADGQTHRITFYFLDWDSLGAPSGRVERVVAQDATTGTTLDSRTLGQPGGDANPANQFNNGKYVIWNVRGHVRFTITNLNSNAVLSGIFFA